MDDSSSSSFTASLPASVNRNSRRARRTNLPETYSILFTETAGTLCATLSSMSQEQQQQVCVLLLVAACWEGTPPVGAAHLLLLPVLREANTRFFETKTRRVVVVSGNTIKMPCPAEWHRHDVWCVAAQLALQTQDIHFTFHPTISYAQPPVVANLLTAPAPPAAEQLNAWVATNLDHTFDTLVQLHAVATKREYTVCERLQDLCNVAAQLKQGRAVSESRADIPVWSRWETYRLACVILQMGTALLTSTDNEAAHSLVAMHVVTYMEHMAQPLVAAQQRSVRAWDSLPGGTLCPFDDMLYNDTPLDSADRLGNEASSCLARARAVLAAERTTQEVVV